MIPNLASHACPPTNPRESCSQYFLDVLSPTSYKSRLKKKANILHLYTLYNTFYKNDNPDDIHLLPSILSSTISYPLVGMNRSINNQQPLSQCNRMSTNATSKTSPQRLSARFSMHLWKNSRRQRRSRILLFSIA